MPQSTTARTSAYQPPRRARFMSAANVVMRQVLRLPFPTPLSGSLMLLSFTGRKSGRTYRQPVSYVRDGDLLLTPGGGRWKLNLRDDQPVRIRVRGRDVWARPEFIRDPDEVERTLTKMVALNPRVASFVPIVGPRGEVDRARVETAVSHGFAIIRWHLDQPDLAPAPHWP
jgi:deazaflavin-dependent oxidoreductase (nitroreductase family)